MVFWINLEHSTRHLLYVTECMVNGNAWALRTICVYLLGPYLSFFPNTYVVSTYKKMDSLGAIPD